MTLLYMVTSGIKTSGAMKSYRNTTEAAYGGVDIFIKDIINSNLSKALDTSLSDSSFTTSMTNYVSSLNSAQINQVCFRPKLTTTNASWPSACSDGSLEATKNPDLKFNLKATNGPDYYVVYAKIVDTMEYVTKDYENGVEVVIKSIGNTDLSPNLLEAAGTTERGEGGAKNPSQPYRYRVEIQASRPASSTEKSKLSVMYVY
jgi:hypothetical protein